MGTHAKTVWGTCDIYADGSSVGGWHMWCRHRLGRGRGQYALLYDDMPRHPTRYPLVIGHHHGNAAKHGEGEEAVHAEQLCVSIDHREPETLAFGGRIHIGRQGGHSFGHQGCSARRPGRHLHTETGEDPLTRSEVADIYGEGFDHHFQG